MKNLRLRIMVFLLGALLLAPALAYADEFLQRLVSAARERTNHHET